MEKQYDFKGVVLPKDEIDNNGFSFGYDIFDSNNGIVVPLVRNHDYWNPEACIGACALVLEDEGLIGYCSLNKTMDAEILKVTKTTDLYLSMYALNLKRGDEKSLVGLDIKGISVTLTSAFTSKRDYKIEWNEEEKSC